MAWHPDDIQFLESLTGDGGKGKGQWRCLVRNGRMLLLIRAGASRDVLKLYRPQRLLARCVHAFLDLTYAIGGCKLLKRFDFVASEGSALVTIENETKAQVQAVLFGNAKQEERRAIMFLKMSDGAHRIAKVGVGPKAKSVIVRECEFINSWSAGCPAMPECGSLLEGEHWAAFTEEFLDGESVGEDDTGEVLDVLSGWSSGGSARPLCEFQQWEEVIRGWSDSATAQAIEDAGARIRLVPALAHGDLAPWNVIRESHEGLKVIDWERGVADGIPGWDWVHFLSPNRSPSVLHDFP